MIVYHGTTQRSAKRIRMEGFRPRGASKRVWFARSRRYAQQRARSKAQRAHDRAVVLTCDIDIPELRQRLGSSRVMYRGRIVAISGPVPASVLRSHPGLGAPGSPEELVRWVNTVLGVKPYKGVGKNHPGILRLSRWVENRLAANPGGHISEQELLALARQWLPEYFDGVEVDFERLRTLPKVGIPEEKPEPSLPDREEEKPDIREEEALDCLVSDKGKRRARGLSLLAELEDPDLFDWCAMFLEDRSMDVRVQALKLMRFCEDADPELIERFADSPEKSIRAAAIEVLLLHAKEEESKWFWRGLTDPDSHVRLATVRHLEKLEPAENREIFETAFYDPHPDVARIARRLTGGKGFGKLVW